MKLIVTLIIVVTFFGCDDGRNNVNNRRRHFVLDSYHTLERPDGSYPILYKRDQVKDIELIDADLEGWGVNGNFVLLKGKVKLVMMSGETFMYPDDYSVIVNNKNLYLFALK